MSVVLVAVGGSLLVGAYSANKAAGAAEDATNKGLAQSGALADQSRESAINLYNQGRKSAQTGLGAAFDFYKKAAPTRYQPIMLGNAAAQKAIGQGAAQANNAILGNAVDMSFAQPQTITPDMSFIQNAQLPVIDQTVAASQPQLPAVAPVQQAQTTGLGNYGQNYRGIR